MSRVSLTLVAILAVGLGACDRGAPEAAQESSAVGAKSAESGSFDRSRAGELMPAVNLVDPEGRVLNLGAIEGTPVLLNLWATWCAPCVKEMPLLDTLASDYEGRLAVVVASQDLQGAQKVAPFFEKAGFARLEPWMDPENQLAEALDPQGLPTTVLYDGRGREVWRVAGDLDWSRDDVRAVIDRSLAEARHSSRTD